MLYVGNSTDNPLYCIYEADAGCRFLDTRLQKEVILIDPASSIFTLLNATQVALPKAGFNRARYPESCLLGYKGSFSIQRQFWLRPSGLWYSIVVFSFVVDYYMFKLCVEQFSGYAIITVVIS